MVPPCRSRETHQLTRVWWHLLATHVCHPQPKVGVAPVGWSFDTMAKVHVPARTLWVAPAPKCVESGRCPPPEGGDRPPDYRPGWRLPWEAVPSMWGPPVRNRHGRGRGGCARRTHAYLMGARPPSPSPVCRKWSLPAARGRRSAVNPGLSPGVAVASGGCAQYVGPAGRGVGLGFVFIVCLIVVARPFAGTGRPLSGTSLSAWGQTVHACIRVCSRVRARASF